ncbi:hypothetical protein [Shivajiella indica]|uniref:Uncharacterized protein n=1 Tax=Shivajiella indica TaxID=872115 RepID=A0ABW5BCY8_9BACT
MSITINEQYLKEYAAKFTGKICDDYYSSKEYMTGQAIVQLSPVTQVNFFIIKALFEAWQMELEKLKSNPYFDYRDITVHEALREFMNVLSRTIKIKRRDFEPLVEKAVSETILLALDPVSYFEKEFDKYEANQLNTYLKDNKKYFKWHVELIENLIDKAGLSRTHSAYKSHLKQNFVRLEENFVSGEKLLDSFNTVIPLDYQMLTKGGKPAKTEENISQKTTEESKQNSKAITEEHEKAVIAEEKPTKINEVATNGTLQEGARRQAIGEKAIDPGQIWEKFESEGYAIMKGTIKDLTESVGINQRIMFTKALFDGNPDLLQNALKSINSCSNFSESVQLLNNRFVEELKWDKNSEVVKEFLQLVYRKFDVKG